METQNGRNWWGYGLAAGFVAMLVVNGFVIWFAINNADTIVSSYEQESR